jgi:hypothetical protein
MRFGTTPGGDTPRNRAHGDLRGWKSSPVPAQKKQRYRSPEHRDSRRSCRVAQRLYRGCRGRAGEGGRGCSPRICRKFLHSMARYEHLPIYKKALDVAVDKLPSLLGLRDRLEELTLSVRLAKEVHAFKSCKSYCACGSSGDPASGGWAWRAGGRGTRGAGTRGRGGNVACPPSTAGWPFPAASRPRRWRTRAGIR